MTVWITQIYLFITINKKNITSNSNSQNIHPCLKTNSLFSPHSWLIIFHFIFANYCNFKNTNIKLFLPKDVVQQFWRQSIPTPTDSVALGTAYALAIPTAWIVSSYPPTEVSLQIELWNQPSKQVLLLQVCVVLPMLSCRFGCSWVLFLPFRS